MGNNVCLPIESDISEHTKIHVSKKLVTGIDHKSRRVVRKFQKSVLDRSAGLEKLRGGNVL